MDLPKRKPILLSGYDYSKNGCYFVTICTQDRKCIFGDIIDHKMVLNNVGNIVQNVCETLPNRFPITSDEYQIMPNHIHTIINIVGVNIVGVDIVGAHHDAPVPKKRSLLSQIVGYFKMNSTKQIH